MAVKYAEAHLQLAPRLGIKPTRTRDAEAKLDLKVSAPVSPSALGGQTITLTIKGAHADEVLKLLAVLQRGGEATDAALARLKELSGESSNPATADGDDSRSTA